MNDKGYEAAKFAEWAEGVDMGALEDVRDHVIAHCLNNASDVPAGMVFETAQATLNMYLDDSEAAEVFNAYR